MARVLKLKFQRLLEGHDPLWPQVSVLSTDYRSDLRRVAAWMFARWSQENFLKYMREHFWLDRLVQYGTEPLPETTRVDQLKAERKAVSKHIEWKELPEADRFERLRVERKHLVDTVKLIAYRAETALMHVVRENLARDHWQIENGQHHRRDRTQDEDRCMVKETNSASGEAAVGRCRTTSAMSCATRAA